MNSEPSNVAPSSIGNLLPEKTLMNLKLKQKKPNLNALCAFIERSRGMAVMFTAYNKCPGHVSPFTNFVLSNAKTANTVARCSRFYWSEQHATKLLA